MMFVQLPFVYYVCFYCREFYFAQKQKNTKTQKHKNTKTQKHKNTKTQINFVFLCFVDFLLITYTVAVHLLGDNPKFANKKVYMRRNSV